MKTNPIIFTRQNLRRIENRFWYQVERTDGCWKWLGSKTPEGYGKIQWSAKTTVGAHRLAYVLLKGPIPNGFTIDHLCRNPSCVNPDHLEAVTLRENILRGTGPTANQARQTHCLRGHEFTPHNTAMQGNRRRCLECRRIRDNARPRRNP